ncbi:FtsX-like permease family protein [Sphingobacterium sp. DK4209]|uniref:FtsX-like permease family protein n=1 Tax=Sphingobacterium zhuxiongii TaxID=2662364 RepID=A0A5Q0Q7V4_9SPHI|nr:FtsX-like permease family protein [Sphingobacterium sp. DK4209]QGA25446.1 FtsX-like permease family protein [Sphingobacterium sp. dk4302]
MWLSFKNSLRHLKRNKLFTFLNILGLTIGISSCWVIYRYVSFELSYEQGLPNKDNVYRVLSNFKRDGQDEIFGGLSRPIYFYMKNEMDGLENVVPSFRMFVSKIDIPAIPGQDLKQEEPEFTETAVISTAPSYFDLIPHTWLAGDKSTALNAPYQLVLTEKRAKHYFPKLDYLEMIGKTIVYNDSIKKVVSGIVANLTYPSEFNGQEFVLLEETAADKRLANWTNSNGNDKVYFVAKDPSSATKALNKIQAVVKSKWEDFKAETNPTYEYNRSIVTMPIKESHFATSMNERGAEKTSLNVIYGLIGVGIFLLLLACINYINLTTAQLPQRHKEIGIRKTLGGSRKSLILQMMLETTLIVGIATILSTFVVQFAFALLGDLITENIKAYANPLLFATFLSVVLGITILLAGFYPSWMISKVNAVDIFRNKGSVAVGQNRLNLRKTLIVFQFIIAQIFIVGALIVGQQLKFVVEKDMGFYKDAVVLINLPYKLFRNPNYSKKTTLANEIRKIPGVEAVTMGTAPLSLDYSSMAMDYMPKGKLEPIVPNIFLKIIDDEYLDFYDLKLIAGSPLLASDTTNGFLINETAARTYGFKSAQDAIGEIIGQKGYAHPIVGVIKDFHAKDFYSNIQPMALLHDTERLDEYAIRLDPANKKEWPQVMERLKSTWSKFFPVETLQYSFYDESILAMYKKEQNLYKLTNISTGIAIIISCLGLFGLATITAFQRSKEIGIRKVLGASITGIVSMLSRDFVKMVLLAILIASPIIWWACNKWLEDFAYRIDISWKPFILGGSLAILAALLTVSYQAIKAAKTNPVDSLRDE